ncbi:MAG TPA: hypothetical protein VHY79_04630 [Rhizomicrobium sp.]|jgi:hypothetical protein|nr:hypothetical protein [Rhizomicrobium sp.]
MTDDPFAEAQSLADNPEAWKEPARCDEWIGIMNAIADNESERPEARAEAELLVKRLREAKEKPAPAGK